jgi:hypothetical protein
MITYDGAGDEGPPRVIVGNVLGVVGIVRFIAIDAIGNLITLSA